MDIDFSLAPEIILILFSAGVFAGFIDSIAGGGGLISLPVLLAVGLPPSVALGTNKLQGSFGTLASSYNYIKRGEIDLRSCLPGIFFTFIGAVAGSWTVQVIAPGFLKHVIPLMLLVVFVNTLFSPKLGYESRPPRLCPKVFFFVAGMSLGFYDGFFGPGTGSFWTAALCIFLGLEMTSAAGITRVMNFTSNIVALSMFMVGGNVLYTAGIVMALGQIVGARAGSNLAIDKGARVIRPLFLTVVLLTVVRLVYQNYF